MSAGPSDAPLGFDFDDGELESTTVGTEMFTGGKVPNYPTLATIARYEILGRIARGGMAEVYLARAREDDGSVQHVVVKRVLSEMQDDPEMLRMFVEEGRIAVRLFHPNVCHVYEHGGTGGMTYMALEWVHGCALRDAIRRAQPKGLPVPVSVHIAGKIAGALEYVHHATGVNGRPLGIVHQDVTPHNIMIGWTGQVKLLDFGIAKKSGLGVEKGKAPQGKYEYMSPEQVRGRPVDARSDVFALGCCLYESLTGVQLYGRGGPAASMTAIVEEPPPTLASARPGLPAELETIVARALAKRPEDRWQSAGAMAKALERQLAQSREQVTDQRVAISVGVLFTAADKAPLPPAAAQMTGTLQAMGLDDAERVLSDAALGTGARRKTAPAADAWAESFDHAASLPPPPSTSDDEVEIDVEDMASEDMASATIRSDARFDLRAIEHGALEHGAIEQGPRPAMAVAARTPAGPPARMRTWPRLAALMVLLAIAVSVAVALRRPDLVERGRTALGGFVGSLTE